MFRVKFGNFISNVVTTNDENTLRTGLLCYMRGFDFKPKVDSGFFIARNMLYPKLLSASMTLEIIHEHPLGNYIKDGIPTPRINIGKFPHLYTKPSDSNTTTPAPVDNSANDTDGAEVDAAIAKTTGTAPTAPDTQKPKPSRRISGKARPKQPQRVIYQSQQAAANTAAVQAASQNSSVDTSVMTSGGEVITNGFSSTGLEAIGENADGTVILEDTNQSGP